MNEEQEASIVRYCLKYLRAGIGAEDPVDTDRAHFALDVLLLVFGVEEGAGSN